MRGTSSFWRKFWWGLPLVIIFSLIKTSYFPKMSIGVSVIMIAIIIKIIDQIVK